MTFAVKRMVLPIYLWRSAEFTRGVTLSVILLVLKRRLSGVEARCLVWTNNLFLFNRFLQLTSSIIPFFNPVCLQQLTAQRDQLVRVVFPTTLDMMRQCFGPCFRGSGLRPHAHSLTIQNPSSLISSSFSHLSQRRSYPRYVI